MHPELLKSGVGNITINYNTAAQGRIYGLTGINININVHFIQTNDELIHIKITIGGMHFTLTAIYGYHAVGDRSPRVQLKVYK